MAIWDTTLTTLLLSLGVLATLRLEETTNYLDWIGYGLLWGVVGLTSPAALSTLPFLGGWVWFRQWRRGRNCTGAAILSSLVFLIVVAPWIWRCSQLYGRFVPFRSIGGLEFLIGNSSDNTLPANIHVQPSVSPDEMRELLRVGEPAYMAGKQREALEFISEHPIQFAKLTFRRILNTWTGLWEFPPRWTLDGVGMPHILVYSFISLLAFVGLGFALRNGVAGAFPLAAVVVCFPLVYYLTVPAMRYRHPIDPVMTIFFAYGATLFLWRPKESFEESKVTIQLEKSSAD
jgi:hypothetical protein